MQLSLDVTLGAGYKTISDLLIDICKIGCLLKTRCLSRLDDGNGIKAALTSGMIHADKTQLQHVQKVKRKLKKLYSAMP